MIQHDPSSPKGHPRISRFLADHQACGGAFRVERPGEGGSGLRVICGVCGESIEHSAGEVAELALPDPLLSGPEVAGRRGSGPSPERQEGSRARARGREPARRAMGGRTWLPIALAVAAIAIAIVALVRGGDDGGDTSAPAETEPIAVEPAPPPQAPPPASERPKDAKAESMAEVRLERRFFLDLFAIGVPRGWSSATEGTEVELVAGKEAGRIAIFHEFGERSPKELASSAARYLRALHDGAAIGKPEYLRIGGRRAARVTADFGGGSETAVILAGGGYTFVMLTRLEDDSRPALAAAADAAIASFKPT